MHAMLGWAALCGLLIVTICLGRLLWRGHERIALVLREIEYKDPSVSEYVSRLFGGESGAV
jgi:uncharacterized iron-regulated membrane protein